jgi:hypothetical protein
LNQFIKKSQTRIVNYLKRGVSGLRFSPIEEQRQSPPYKNKGDQEALSAFGWIDRSITKQAGKRQYHPLPARFFLIILTDYSSF